MTDDDKPALALKSVRVAAKPKLSLKASAPRPMASLSSSSSTTTSSSASTSPASLTFAPKAHVHGPSCNHDHDDHGHDSHDSHDHGHDHAPRERAMTTRAGEDGSAALQLDLAALLPGERDERGRFERLVRAAAASAGVTRVHLRGDAGFLQACVHHDGARDVDAVAADVRAAGAAIARRFRTKTWLVRGMDSAQCGMVIEHVLGRTRGILQADVSYAAERIVVEYDADLLDERGVEKLVEHVGYDLETPGAGHVCSIHGNKGGLAPKLELPLVIASGALLVVGLLLRQLTTMPALVSDVVFAVSLFCGGFFSTRSALVALRAKKVDIETLMVLAAVGAALLGAWFEGAFLLFLFSLGHMLEHRAMDRARRAVESLEKLRPDTARRKIGNDVKETKLDDVDIGDIIVVRPGDRVPLDGVVVDGASQIDQAALTGESVPVPKSAGDGVFAGTINKDGSLEVRVTKPAGESSLARLVDLVASAEARKSKTQRWASRVEQLFVPLVLIAAPSLVVALWAAGTPVRDAVLRGLSLLVAASPCALAVSSPAAVLSAIATAARHGVLIKGGAHLEALAGIKIVALDKTGTLTEGKPRVVDVRCFDIDEATLVTRAAAAEQLSAHPLAQAVVDAARARSLSLPPAEDLAATHGQGLEATVDSVRVRIGNARLFGGRDALPARVNDTVDELERAGRTTMIVSFDDAFVGVLGVMDTPRAAARTAVRALKAHGIERTVMLSGDAAAVAKAVAKEVGVDEARAPLLPEDKVNAVKELLREAPTAMVGDGVNDAPALASATIGVAMGGAGSDVALETADVVLMGDDLTNLAWAIELSQAATRAVKQNIALALGVAGVLVVASVGGFVAVSEAVVLHEGSTLVVVANGLRLLLHRKSA